MPTPVTATSALDAFLRHQINVERYKNYNVQQSLDVINLIKNRLAAQLVRTGKDKLSDLTKREFNKFVSDFNKSYAEIFGKYETAQLAEFKKFFKADFNEIKYLFKQTGHETYKGASADSLWAKMLSTPTPGIGTEPKNMFKVFSSQANVKIANALKAGYAENLTLSNIMQSIVGSGDLRFKDGLINKFENQISATVQTYIQQMTSFLSESVGDQVGETYQWVSILDSATTAICQSRDGQVYKYGEGPMPPAHYSCRSTTMPVVAGAIKDMPSLFDWMTAQPTVVQNEILGTRLGVSLRAGDLKADDLPSFNRMSPLTLDQFKSKRDQLFTPRKAN